LSKKSWAIEVEPGVHLRLQMLEIHLARGRLDVAAQRASWITRCPGGVGPMTVAMLMQNTFIAAAG
jgi:hypothetical protein